MPFANRSLLAVFLSTILCLTAAQAEEHSPRPEFTRLTRVHGTIVDVAVSNPDFSTLVAALQAADLVSTLQGPGPFTVFAPTNSAFAKIPEGILNFLLADPAALTSVLTYHVTAGRKDLRYSFIPWKLKTVQGQVVYGDRDRFSLSINNAQVQGRVIVADNGLIYVIDSVLLPQFQ
ncbi:putative surface protein with fasciclin (FAS1) repeats [Povalibacter uvarum]|uniref:Putative surface protein with fasciclin (FAS1) repeats n=1 Tax=Povalibacter uvarum TaxID=732238 RepID=A0A841HHX7_9GAMM|nr:fasciclin domain-containing protein [Povalibacter uvarum]MBB6092396.1 putative surface protein with fasciclin (FAS1) repeats [Povalibacter uvarum]